MGKLRVARRRAGLPVVLGSALVLPVASAAFPCVLCSQVIEHIGRGPVLDELDRVLQPGGRLILGTPDYAKWQWRAIENVYKFVLPQGYEDEHITHYSFAELVAEFVHRRNYALESVRYILGAELTLALRKPGRLPLPASP
jgi:SAM-dependent methyltransferase